MSINRIKALCLRHLYPLRRDLDLLSDMIYWPIIDTILWGVTSQWLFESSGIPGLVAAILIGLILWNVIWRSQAEVSRNLIDEIWNSNLVNLFSTPLQLREWIGGILLLSIVKTGITISLLSLLVVVLYHVNFLTLGLWLVVFIFLSTMSGWWIGFISASIVIRFGPKMQNVVWTLPGILLPFSAIYFPVDRLPESAQIISKLIPTTYVFEAMRSVLSGNYDIAHALGVSLLLNGVYLTLSIWFFVRSFAYSKTLGLGRFE